MHVRRFGRALPRSRGRTTTPPLRLCHSNGHTHTHTQDLTELWMAHVAWFEYSTTIRIQKHYKFALSPAYVGGEMSFASYPGYLSSLDDFWTVWSSGLGVMECVRW